MALNAELLQKSGALKELTEAQIAAIVTLSENDEEQVMKKRIGDVHRDYDKDIEEALGLKRPSDVHTYDFLKREVYPKVKTVKETEDKLTTALNDVKDLKKQLRDGIKDEKLKTELEESEKLVGKLRGQLTAKDKEWQGKLDKAEKDAANNAVGFELDRALIGKKFKDEKLIDLETRNMVLQSGRNHIISSYGHKWLEKDGKKTLVFLDAEGEILRNEANSLHPYTAEELYIDRVKGVLDLGTKGAGTGHSGGDPGGNGGGGSSSVDISGAKTQKDAADILTTQLMQAGEVRGTEAFKEKFDKAWDENKVSELPMR